MHFPDATTGYIAGIDWTNEMVVALKTTNGGISWTDISTSGLGDEDVRCIFCTDINTCYMSFSGGDIITSIMKTTDGGNTWNDITPTIAGSVWSICFVDENTGYATGQKDGWGYVIKTENAGNDWTEVFSQDQVQRGKSICFSDLNTGCMVTDEGQIVKTTDAGNTWNIESSGVTTEFNSVYFPSNDVEYIVGDDGVILKFEEAIGIDNHVSPHEIQVNFYPNPFETKAILKINDDTQLISAELRIYDTYGREVCKITNIRNNEIELNRKGLNSGLYFYRLSENYRVINIGKIIVR